MKKNFRKNVKRTAAVVLAASMVAGSNGISSVTAADFANVVEAAEADANGFVIEGTVLMDYQGTATEVVIPDGITEIGESAFVPDEENQYIIITSVSFPDTVVKIDENAFAECTGLTAVKLPAGLTFLGGCAFRGTNITMIEIPKTLEDADYRSFYNEQGPFFESALSTAVFEEGTTTIADYLFAGAATLKSIEIPDTVTTIKNSAFRDTGLESIVIGENVTKIEEGAFYNCVNATSLELNKNLAELDGGAFGNCTGITSVEIPASLKDADKESYHDDRGPFYGSGLSEVAFEDKTTVIASYLFSGAKNLKSIEIPDTVTIIENNAFYTSNLESITLGEYVTRVDSAAFYGCENLADVKLNDYVEYLGQQAFGNCAKITSIHIPASLVDADSDLWEEKGPFANTSIAEVTFEEGIEVIASNLLQSIPTLKKVTIPNTVEVIEENAFKNTPLEEVNVPWSVFEIGESAFCDCTALTSVNMTDNTDTMGEYAFSGCTSLTDIRLSKRLRTISKRAFYGNTALETITIPDRVTAIEEGAFADCTSLANIDTTGSVKVIESEAFRNTGFEKLILWEGLEEINSQAFECCEQLTRVVLPDSLVKLGENVFYNCPELEEVIFGTGLISISSGTFSDCGSLKKVVIPYGVKEINPNVFNNCTSLTEVTIPKTVETLEEGIFSYPKKVTVFGVEGSEAEFYAEDEGCQFEAVTTVATGVALNETDIVMYTGQEKKLGLHVTPAEFTDDVTWSVSNEEIVTVDEEGNVKAHNPGETIVTVYVGEKEATCSITVMDAVIEDTKWERMVVPVRKLYSPIKTKVAVLEIPESAIVSPEVVVVRAENIGHNDRAYSYKQAKEVLDTTDKYNTDLFELYDISMTNQAIGNVVELNGMVKVTVDVSYAMDMDKVTVVRLKDTESTDMDAGQIEELVVSVSEDDGTLSFETNTMGVFAVLQTAEESMIPINPTPVIVLGDVDGNGCVELVDAHHTFKTAMGINTFSVDSMLAGDVDKDGQITLLDAKQIYYRALLLTAGFSENLQAEIPDAVLTTTQADGKLTCDIMVENADVSMVGYGITYDNSRLKLTGLDWDYNFYNNYARSSLFQFSQLDTEYVYLGMIGTGSGYTGMIGTGSGYTGKIGTLTFEIIGTEPGEVELAKVITNTDKDLNVSVGMTAGNPLSSGNTGNEPGENSGGFVEEPMLSYISTVSSDVLKDIDGDGSVTLADARTILRVALKISKLSGVKTDADNNGDGKIDLSDAQRLFQAVMGINVAGETESNVVGMVDSIPDVTAKAELKDGQLYYTISVNNAELDMLDYGVVYDKKYLEVVNASWAAELPDDSLDIRANQTEQSYVALGYINASEDTYSGTIARIRFKVKSDLTGAAPIMLVPNSAVYRGDFTGAENKEGTVLTQIADLKEAVEETPVPDKNPEEETPTVSAAPGEETPATDKETTTEEIKNEDGTVTNKVTEKETSSDGTVSEKITETIVGTDGVKTEKVQETVTKPDGSTVTTTKETVTKPSGVVETEEKVVKKDEVGMLVSLLNKLIQMAENIFERLTKIEKQLADGSLMVKSITEVSDVDKAGNVVTGCSVVDERSVSGVSVEKYEYDAKALPTDVEWNTQVIDKPDADDTDVLKAKGATDYTVYDIVPQSAGKKTDVKDGKVKVSLHCGDKWKGKKVKVFDFEKNQWLDAVAEGQYVSFYAEHFSKYAIAEVMDVKRGDTNLDGEITLPDAQLALKAALKIEELTKEQEKAADVDGTEGLALSDAQMILRAALQIELLE